MAYLMGIDLGTSSVKIIIMDIDGNVLQLSSRGYPIDMPFTDFCVQSPELWWQSAAEAIAEAIQKTGIHPKSIKCVGLSGQMHGTVLVDKCDRAIGTAIIHSDQRSKKQVEEIYDIIGRDEFGNITKNQLFPGFQLASLLWVSDNMPDNLGKSFICSDSERLPEDEADRRDRSRAYGCVSHACLRHEYGKLGIRHTGKTGGSTVGCFPG